MFLCDLYMFAQQTSRTLRVDLAECLVVLLLCATSHLFLGILSQMECLGQLSGLLAQEPDVFKVIIVDSIIVSVSHRALPTLLLLSSSPGPPFMFNLKWIVSKFSVPTTSHSQNNRPRSQATFRTDYTGRGELAERQQTLNQAIAVFRRIAEEWNVAVIFTNQMSANPAGGMTFVSDPKQVGKICMSLSIKVGLFLHPTAD